MPAVPVVRLTLSTFAVPLAALPLLVLAWLFALGTLAPVNGARANTAAAAAVPAAVKAALPEASLVGGAPFRWFGLKLYDARLWADRKAITPDNWASTPLALELVYARSLEGDRIAKASIDEIRQLGIGTTTQQAAWLEAMKRVFPDVVEGTQLIGVYAPGQPTQFLRDGQLIAEVADPDFGKAFFAIWLNAKTSAPKLRSALFGQKP